MARTARGEPHGTRPDTPPGDLTVPLVFDGTRLYLERYWRFEQRVADDLLRRAEAPGGIFAASAALDEVLDGLFGPDDAAVPDRQRQAATAALTRRLAVVAGGPGTGKTRTIARLLVAARRPRGAEGRSLEVALAAPTGKASARMTEAVHHEVEVAQPNAEVAAAIHATEASTLHRLLGGSPTGRFRHDRHNPLPHDLVIVDETSMVSLPLMARLLDAVRPDATVVLVGDPFQLASIEAGAVLGEIVGPATTGPATGPLAPSVVLLDRVHRFGADSAIAALADAIRTGAADAALAVLHDAQAGEVAWVDADDEPGVAQLQREAADAATDVVRAAQAGHAEQGLDLATDLKILCATRHGRLGVYRWTDRIEDLTGPRAPRCRASAAGGTSGARSWSPATTTRTACSTATSAWWSRRTDAAQWRSPAVLRFRTLAPAQLADIETWWAMTIHKSQGSEFGRIVVTLPPPPSPILTRELLYTAVTRAKEHVTIVASEASLRAAITRPVARASGLGARLWG